MDQDDNLLSFKEGELSQPMSENLSQNGDKNIESTDSLDKENLKLNENADHSELNTTMNKFDKFDKIIDFKSLYNSNYNKEADDLSYNELNEQSNQIINLINTNQFKHTVKIIKNSESKIRAFLLDKFAKCHTFVIHFQVNDIFDNSNPKKPKRIDYYRIKPNILNEINKMSIILNGENMIYHFISNAEIKKLKSLMDDTVFNFENDHVTGVSFDSKHSYKIMKICFGLDDECLDKIFWHDVKTALWCIDSDKKEPLNIIDILFDYLKVNNVAEFNGKVREANRLSEDQNALNQTILLYPIMVNLIDILKSANLYENYVYIELPCIELFAKMESLGLTLDVLYLNKSITEWKKYIDLLQNEIKVRNQGADVNVRSPKQVQQLLKTNGLYKRYIEKFKPEGLTEDDLKTGKDILERMKEFEPFDPLPGYILDSRKIFHYIGVAEDYIKERGDGTTVIGTYKHFISTGRVAMMNPNLLGVDNDFSFTINDDKYDVSLKRAFTAKRGFRLVAADYSQIELRILASLSGDYNLISILESGQDPFKMISSKITKKEIDDVTTEERDSAKQIVYSILYGCGIQRLTDNLRSESEEKTKEFLKDFHSAFPNLDPFIEQCKEYGRKHGYTTTLFNRRRYVPDILDEDPGKMASHERKAVNSRIQGSAADIVKASMLRITSEIKKQNIDAQLLLQIHDELIFQIRDDEKLVKEFIDMIIEKMTNYESILKAKLNVKVKTGHSWGELINYEEYPWTEI